MSLERRASAEGINVLGLQALIQNNRVTESDLDEWSEELLGEVKLFPGVRSAYAQILGVSTSNTYHKLFDRFVEESVEVRYLSYFTE